MPGWCNSCVFNVMQVQKSVDSAAPDSTETHLNDALALEPRHSLRSDLRLALWIVQAEPARHNAAYASMDSAC